MNDKFTKCILAGILLCLVIIAIKPVNNQTNSPYSNINITSGKQVLQLSPNRIAIVESRENSGLEGTILIFDFDSNTKNFNYIGSMNYADYFKNPNKYGIPLK